MTYKLPMGKIPPYRKCPYTKECSMARNCKREEVFNQWYGCTLLTYYKHQERY